MANGKARRATCPASPLPGLAIPVSDLTNAARVLLNSGGVSLSVLDQGTTTGGLTVFPARFPSTITASTGWPASDVASCVAPAAPIWPLVETSITERLRVSPESACARSNITAVLYRSALPGDATASRWLTTTIVPLPRPGRVAMTFSRVCCPAVVWAVK